MKIFTLTLCLFLTCSQAFAQQPATVVRSTQIMTDGTNRYYVHRVKKGETAYSICRAYGIGEAELKRDNPSVAKIYPNLQSDMWLKILITEATENPQKIEAEPAKTPATANVSRHQKSSTAADGVTLLEHKVRRKETLFSISNMYEVDIDFIKQYNPQIFAEGKGVIKARQVLQIPISLSGLKKGSAIKLSEQSARCDSGARSMSSLNVALLLPFNAEMQDDVEQLDRSFRFLEVYEGAMLALENLRQQGLSVNLSVFDTKSATTEMLLRNASLAKADLIIGPVYQEMLKPIAEFARQRNIKIVSPLLSVDSALYGNNNVFQIPVDFDKQMQQLLVHDGLNVKANNVILVSQRDEEASRNLRNDLRQYLPKTDSVIFRNMAVNKDSSAMEELRLLYETQLHRPTVKILQYKIGLQPRENQEVFLRIFNPEIENKVVVASQDEPFVSELLLNLKAFSDRYKCRITVYGTSNWQKFDNIERKLFYDLKLHVAAPYYIKYYSENVKQFVHSFREKYKTEPSQFAFQGYDVMLYFASAMHRYGKDFEGCLPYHKVPLLQSNYSFAPICADGAYENVGVFLLRYTPWLEIIQYE